MMLLPWLQLTIEGNAEHVSGIIRVSLVHNDNTLHSVCSLATIEEDGPSNLTKRVAAPDFITE